MKCMIFSTEAGQWIIANGNYPKPNDFGGLEWSEIELLNDGEYQTILVFATLFDCSNTEADWSKTGVKEVDSLGQEISWEQSITAYMYIQEFETYYFDFTKMKGTVSIYDII